MVKKHEVHLQYVRDERSGARPIGGDWVRWVPRSYTKIADKLAGLAIESRRSRYFVRKKRWQACNLLLVCDAGVSRASRTVGVGWALLGAPSGELLVLGSTYFAEVPPEQLSSTQWELKALTFGLQSLALARADRLRELREVCERDGATFTDSERRRIRGLWKGLGERTDTAPILPLAR